MLFHLMSELLSVFSPAAKNLPPKFMALRKAQNMNATANSRSEIAKAETQ